VYPSYQSNICAITFFAYLLFFIQIHSEDLPQIHEFLFTGLFAWVGLVLGGSLEVADIF